jgi:hypothetical protein
VSVDLNSLTREQLQQRRNDLHVQLAAVNDRLHAMGATRNGDLAAGRITPDLAGAAPLDPSDPSA